MSQRVGGIIQFNADGVMHDAFGEWTYGIGAPKRDPVIGTSKVVGYTETPQVSFAAGAIIDRPDLNLKAFLNLSGATVTLSLANGKVIAYRAAWYAGDGNVETKEGKIEVRIEALDAEEI